LFYLYQQTTKSSEKKLFSTSQPIRPGLECLIAQIMTDKPIESLMFNRIKNDLLAAIGFTNHNSILQYLHNPHIHYNLDGEPTLIIGNASDNQGEFTLISITVAAGCKYFGTISITSRAPAGIAGPDALVKAFLEGTIFLLPSIHSVLPYPFPQFAYPMQSCCCESARTSFCLICIDAPCWCEEQKTAW